MNSEQFKILAQPYGILRWKRHYPLSVAARVDLIQSGRSWKSVVNPMEETDIKKIQIIRGLFDLRLWFLYSACESSQINSPDKHREIVSYSKVSYSCNCLCLDFSNKTGNEEAFLWKKYGSFLAFPLQSPSISSNSICVGFNLGYSALQTGNLKMLMAHYSCVDNFSTLKFEMRKQNRSSSCIQLWCHCVFFLKSRWISWVDMAKHKRLKTTYHIFFSQQPTEVHELTGLTKYGFWHMQMDCRPEKLVDMLLTMWDGCWSESLQTCLFLFPHVSNHSHVAYGTGCELCIFEIVY